MRRAWVLAPSLLIVTFVSRDAHAYRPFDGTDGDVAALGEFELELGPIHYYSEGPYQYLVTPATVLNLGFAKGYELVMDFKPTIGLEHVDDQSRARVVDTDVLVKHVLREGVLQGKTGLSIALEAGPLTPEIQGDSHFGAQADLIMSTRWDTGAIHVNSQLAYNRIENIEGFESVILEGPSTYHVRPVTEFYVDHDFGNAMTMWSALGGAIWDATPDLAIDMALREARVGDEHAAEVRLGLTWTIEVWATTPDKESRRRRHGGSFATF